MLLWGLGFLFPMKLRLSIEAPVLSVLPVARAGRECDLPVSCPPSPQTLSLDRRKQVNHQRNVNPISCNICMFI